MSEEIITVGERLRVSENMIKFGGSFVKALGKALSHADLHNQRKIKETFSAYWNQYEKWDELKNE